MLRIRLRLSLKFTLVVLGAMIAAWTSRSIAAGSSQEGATSGSPPAESSETAAESALSPEDSAKTPVAAKEGVADRSYRHAAIITIRDEITDVTTVSLKRRIEAARKAGADLVVFELDTPGGYLDSALDIAHLIENTRDLRTAAWVNPQAHSAGTIIAVACNEIVMAPSSTMGDSQVIMFGAEGADAVPEALQPKVYTPVLARFRSSAKLNGYSEVLCEAFVIPEREVWWLENARTGEREFVFREEKQKRLGEREAGSDGNAVQKVTRAILGMSEEGAAATGEWRLVESYVDLVTGKTIALTQPIDREDQLLEMNAGEAHAFGFNRAIIAQDADLQARYGAATITRMDTLWSENLAMWLTSPYVRGFLLILVFLGAYVEFNTPGVGVPGLVALIALAIFVGAPYLTGLANTWELVLIGVGIVLLAVEVFVLPGFGIAGVSGALLLLAGLVATFMPDEPGRTSPLYVPQLQPTIDGLVTGLKVVVIGMFASFAGMFVLARYLPRSPLIQKLIPLNEGPNIPDDPYQGQVIPGDIGISLGPLRPAGKMRLGNLLVDVVTQGEYIESGVNVRVIERQGNRVVVQQAR